MIKEITFFPIKIEPPPSIVDENFRDKIMATVERFEKVQMTKWAYLPMILTLGLFTLYQNHSLSHALLKGDIALAKRCVCWGGTAYMDSRDIVAAAKSGNEKRIDAIRFLIAQTSLTENSWHDNEAAEEIVAARDDHRAADLPPVMLEILPESIVPRTGLWRVQEFTTDLDTGNRFKDVKVLRTTKEPDSGEETSERWKRSTKVNKVVLRALSKS